MSKTYIGSTGLQYVLTKIKNVLDGYVTKETGKGLSSNDYDATAVAEVAKVANKVDKVDGKGLSTNDYDNDAVAEVAKIANKVDAVSGKGLSTNDLTDELKTQYDAAEANVITSVKVNGTALAITDKAVDVIIPAAATVDSSMSDSSTNAVQNKVVKAYIDGALDDITGIEYVKVENKASLPETGAKGTIYLVPNSGSAGNVFDEYIWTKVDGDNYGYEKIGTTETDLSGYVKDTDISEVPTSDILSMFNNTFGTSYTS